jgi:hypothetical protein
MKDIGLFAKDKTQLIQKMFFVLYLDKNKIKRHFHIKSFNLFWEKAAVNTLKIYKKSIKNL